jgi:prepilin-type N-terminal cleavage/methylation domain-containing protein
MVNCMMLTWDSHKAEWKLGFQYQPKPEVAQEWREWMQQHQHELPKVPPFYPGEWIEFDWDGVMLHGEVRTVDLTWEKCFSWSEPCWKYRLTAYANGHARSIFRTDRIKRIPKPHGGPAMINQPHDESRSCDLCEHYHELATHSREVAGLEVRAGECEDPTKPRRHCVACVDTCDSFKRDPARRLRPPEYVRVKVVEPGRAWVTIARHGTMRPRKEPATMNRKAFTLTELLVVIGIIVILLGLLLAGLNNSQKAAREARLAADLQTIATAINAYRADFGDIPRPDPANASQMRGAEILALAIGREFRPRGPQGRTYGPYVEANLIGPDHLRDYYGHPIAYYAAKPKFAPGDAQTAGRTFLANIAPPQPLNGAKWNAYDNAQAVSFATMAGYVKANADGTPAAESVFADFLLVSPGADGTFGTGDDVTHTESN